MDVGLDRSQEGGAAVGAVAAREPDRAPSGGAAPSSARLAAQRFASELARRRTRRRALAVGAVVLAVLAVGLWLVVQPLAAARTELLGAAAAMERGRTALLEGSHQASVDAFTGAQSSFVHARRRLDAAPVRLLQAAPVVGDDVVAVRRLAAAGEALAKAGAVVTDAVVSLPGGTAALAPRAGRLPVSTIAALAAPLQEARTLLDGARADVEAVPVGGLAGRSAEAHREIEHALDVVERPLDAAVALAHELPAFLGADGPRRYFFAAQNPAEARGAGGLMGAYAILEVEDGELRFGEFAPVQDLPNLPPGEVPPPHPSFAARYDRYGGTGFWLNLNMSPDFPSTAVAIERLYQAVTGERVDGVIAADPAALAALLRVTGPVEVPSFGVVDAETVVPLVTNEAYARYTEAEADERKRFLGRISASILSTFLDSAADGDPVAAGRSLIDAASGGHLLLHSTDPRVQQAFATAGIDGALPRDDADVLAVVVNNAGATKLDFYADRSVRADIALRPDGGAEAVTTVALANNGPSEGLPSYIIGPYWAEDGTVVAPPGETLSIVSVYGGRGAELHAAPDAPALLDATEVGEELGLPVWSSVVRLPSGAATELVHRSERHAAWQPDGSGGGTYRLTVLDQQAVRPTSYALEVEIPPDMAVVEADADLHVTGRSVRFEGTTRHLRTFTIRFAPAAVETTSAGTAD